MTKQKLLVAIFAAVVAVSGVLLTTGTIGALPQANKYSENSLFLGHIELVAKNANGDITAYRQTDNLIVNNGKMCAAINTFGVPTNGSTTACGGVTTNSFRFVGVGTATAAPAAGDNGLGTQIGTRANNGTYTFINSTASTPTYSIQTTFRPNANIAEAGIFDGSAASTSSNSHMFAHQQFTAISLGATDTLTVTWRVTLS